MNEVSIIVEKMLKMDGKKAIFRKTLEAPSKKRIRWIGEENEEGMLGFDKLAEGNNV